MSTSSLESLRAHSKIVVDTANLDEIDKFKPEDATTNPSLICAAIQSDKFAHMMRDAVVYARTRLPTSALDDQVELALDKLTVDIGGHILQKITGRVSTEVDARHSFSIEKSLEKARHIISLYAEIGIPKERVYIKLAATWEGIQTARILEAEGIACNLTLIFAFTQAVACAQAGVSLISPFVGRILDWHVAKGMRSCAPPEEPGVHSVVRICRYFKLHGYPTVVMGASFRNTGEIIALAGCDKLTISPGLLDALSKADGPVDSVLLSSPTGSEPLLPPVTQDEFAFHLYSDPMAIEKLAEGIRKFHDDTCKAKAIIAKAFQ